MRNQNLISFHGRQDLKDAKIADLIRHRLLDNLMQGFYYDHSSCKGCAVTCTMYSASELVSGDVDVTNIHDRYEAVLGVPSIIARLIDKVFEGLPVKHSKQWPLSVIQAMPVGVDLTPVWRKFMIWLLMDDTDGVVKFATNRKIIENVADAFTRSLTTVTGEWPALHSIAYTAAADAYGAGAGAAAAGDDAAAAAYGAAAAAYSAAAYAAAVDAYGAAAGAAAVDYAADAHGAYAAGAAAYAADAYGYSAYAAAAADAYAAAYAADAADYAADAYAADAYAAYAYKVKRHFIVMSKKLIDLLKSS